MVKLDEEAMCFHVAVLKAFERGFEGHLRLHRGRLWSFVADGEGLVRAGQ